MGWFLSMLQEEKDMQLRLFEHNLQILNELDANKSNKTLTSQDFIYRETGLLE